MARREDLPIFPYDVIWEELAEPWLTIEDLAADIGKIELINVIMPKLDKITPSIQRSDVEPLVGTLALPSRPSEQLVQEVYLIGSWFLQRHHYAEIGADILGARRYVKRLAALSREFSELLNNARGEVDIAITQLRPVEPEALNPNSLLTLDDLARETHDVALAAERMWHDTAPKQSGRKTDYVRDTALRLVLEALDRAGAGPLKISRGTSEKHERHLTGATGGFVRDFFSVISPRLSGPLLAQATERVRRMRKQRS